MLDACAPGWTKTDTEHYYCIKWKGLTYPSLPRGSHAGKKGQKKGRTLVEVGHIKHMVHQLNIDMECAKKHLDVLR